MDDEGGLCMLAWKKRTGLGGSIVVSQKWERRWIVVSGNKMVYYSLGKEDAPTPRGVIDLVEQEATIHVPAKNASDAPTPHELDLVAKDAETELVWKLCFDTQQDQIFMLETIHNILFQHGFDEKDFDRFEHDLESGDHVFRWEMIIMPPIIYPIQIHGIVLEAGRNCVIIGDFGLTGYGKQEGENFKHAEDHNASIMAAWKKLRPKEDQRLNIVTCIDPKEIRKWKKANYEASFVENHTGHHNLGKSLTKFFKSTTKGRSSSDSTTVATDATVVDGGRERISSEDSGSVGGRLSKFFSKSNHAVVTKQDSSVTDATVIHEESSGDTKEQVNGDSKEQAKADSEEETGSKGITADNNEGEQVNDEAKDMASGEEANEADEKVSTMNGGENQEQSSEEPRPAKRNDFAEQSSGLEDVALDEEVPSKKSADEARERSQTSDQNLESSGDNDDDSAESPSENKTTVNGDVVESSESGETVESEKKAHEKLPRSDPRKIVLARAHFLLEHGEEILPPYHVFFSNSECIAVWCKTGRWSTLQTAVYLTGHSVGAAKSSTMATIGVAAAHAVFAPVVAVGGLIWVSAPMVILQKSRKKWEEATMKLTPLFWEWAPPEVFVAAIENWSDIR